MRDRMTRFATLAIVPALLAGTSACATKGFVRKEIAASRTLTDSAIAAERVARIAGDSATSAQVQAQVAELRRDLETLRTEFGAKITAMEEGVKFAMPVNFAFDDATVRDADRAALDRFATVAKRFYAGSAITVEGFADPAGTPRYNIKLSERRADNVRQYLLAQGLDAGSLRSVGYGESRQVVPGAERDASGAEQNRRVVFVIETRAPATVATADPRPELPQGQTPQPETRQP